MTEAPTSRSQIALALLLAWGTVCPCGVIAAERIWSYGGGSPSASVANNWIGAAPPAAGDYVVFGDTTPSASCQWDLAVALASMTVTGSYSGVVTLTTDLMVSSGVRLDAGASAKLDLNGHDLEVQGDWVAGAMQTTSTVSGSSVTFYGDGVSNIQSLVGSARFNNLVVNKSVDPAVGEHLLSDIEVFGNFSLLQSSHVAGAHNQILHGDWVVDHPWWQMDSSTLTFAGSAQQSIDMVGSPQGGSIGAVFVWNSTGVWLPGGATIGVLVATEPASTLILQTGAGEIFVGSMTIAGQSAGTRTQLISDTLGTPATLGVALYAAASYIYVRDIDMDTSNNGIGIIAYNSMDGGDNTGWTFLGATRIWQYGGASALASAGSNWMGGVAPTVGDYVVFGATTPKAPCQWDLAVVLTSMTVTGSYSGVVTLTKDLTISSGVRLDGGASAKLDLNGHNLRVQGDWVVGVMQATSTVAGSLVTFYGDGVSSIQSLVGPARFNNLVLNKSVSPAVGEQLLSDIEVFGDFSLLQSSYVAGAHSQVLHGDLVLGDAWLQAGQSTVAFAGSGPQSIDIVGSPQGDPIGAVFVWNSTGPVSLPGGAMMGVLVATEPASTLILQAGASPILVASMTLNGQSAGQRIQLISDTPGVQAILDVAEYAAASYTYVADISTDAGIRIPAYHSVDGGGNAGWTFFGGGVGATRIWQYGGTSALASAGSNWMGGVVPTMGDYVVFGSTTPKAPCQWDLAVTLASMTVTGSYASVVTLTTDLMVSSGVRLDAGSSAKLDLNAHNLQVRGDWVAGAMQTTSTVSGSSVTFYGSGVSNIQSLVGLARFNNLVLNKNGLDPNVAERLLSNIEVFGNFSVLRSSHVAGTHYQVLHGDLVIGDAWLQAGQSTVAFAGAGPQSIDIVGSPQGDPIGAVFVWNSTGPVWFPGGAMMEVLVATEPASTLVLQGGGAVSVGSMTISGQSAGTMIQLISDTPGTPANLSVTEYAAASYTYIADISVGAASSIATYKSVDGGDNSGWTFGAGATRIWQYGGVSALASAGSNWMGGVAPTVGDYVVFGSTTPKAPCQWDLAVALASMTVTGSYSSVVTLTKDLTISSGVRLDAGASAKLDLNGHNLRVRGDWIAGGMQTTSTVSGSSVTFYGSGVSNIQSLVGSARFNNLVLNKSVGPAVVAQLLSDIEVSGNLSLLQSTYSAGTHYQVLHGDLVLGNEWLQVGQSTLAFAGRGPQSIDMAGTPQGDPIGAVFVWNSTGPVWLPGGATLGVLVATEPASTLILQAGEDGDSPISVASMTINGQSPSTMIQLVSDTPGVPATLDVAQYAAVSYAYVEDIGMDTADGGLGVTAYNSVDGGDNSGWTFPGGGAGTTRVWNWQGGDFWASSAYNWIPIGAPVLGDYVIFGSTTPTAPCQWDLGIAVGSLSVTGAYASAVTLWTDLTVTSGGPPRRGVFGQAGPQRAQPAGAGRLGGGGDADDEHGGGEFGDLLRRRCEQHPEPRRPGAIQQPGLEQKRRPSRGRTAAFGHRGLRQLQPAAVEPCGGDALPGPARGPGARQRVAAGRSEHHRPRRNGAAEDQRDRHAAVE